MSASPKPAKPAAPLVRKTSQDGYSATRTANSSSSSSSAASASSVKTGLKKLSVSGEAADNGTITPVRQAQAGASSPASRPRVSPSSSPAGSTPLKASASSAVSTPPSSTAPRRASGTMSSAAPSAAASAQARLIMKAPVQSPTAGGMKMRPASGTGLNNLSSIGVSAMAAAAANPYSSTLSQSPSSSPSSGSAPSPSSPIASLSPTAKRYNKTAGTPTGPSTQPQAASSPIHSISQSGAAAASRSAYPPQGNMAPSNGGASSYRAHGVHPPVNTHANPPVSHVADHPNQPGGGPTIFSPVYTRTASQEQLHQAELKKQGGAGRTEQQQREDAEAQYRQQQQHAAAQYAAQQQQAAAQAQAQAAAQAAAHQQSQNKHTVSYTPPPVEEDEFDPFLFIKNLPPLSPAMRNRRSPLPKKSLSAPKITLALDLDETLVHCSVQPIDRAELTFKVAFNGMDYEVYVRTRPHMKEFLETVSQWFEVIIFTASQKVYADKLLNILDPQGTFIKYRVFRDSCVCIDGNYLKDLHILGRDLPTVAIVDNSVQAFGFQLDNGIPIESWFDDDQDRELLNLIPFLRTLKDVKDVRPLIRDTFRLTEFVASL